MSNHLHTEYENSLKNLEANSFGLIKRGNRDYVAKTRIEST